MSVHECTCGRPYLTEAKQDHCERTHNVAELDRLTIELSEARAQLKAAHEVIRDGIEHIEQDTGAWGGWLCRAKLVLG